MRRHPISCLSKKLFFFFFKSSMTRSANLETLSGEIVTVTLQSYLAIGSVALCDLLQGWGKVSCITRLPRHADDAVV